MKLIIISEIKVSKWGPIGYCYHKVQQSLFQYQWTPTVDSLNPSLNISLCYDITGTKTDDCLVTIDVYDEPKPRSNNSVPIDANSMIFISFWGRNIPRELDRYHDPRVSESSADIGNMGWEFFVFPKDDIQRSVPAQCLCREIIENKNISESLTAFYPYHVRANRTSDHCQNHPPVACSTCDGPTPVRVSKRPKIVF